MSSYVNMNSEIYSTAQVDFQCDSSASSYMYDWLLDSQNNLFYAREKL